MRSSKRSAPPTPAMEKQFNHSQAAFTLLELMLAIGLIALAATFISISIGRSDSKLALLEAKRFVALVNAAQNESILTGRPIELVVNLDERQYQFTSVKQPEFFTPQLAANDQVESIDDQDKPLADHFLKPRKIPQAVKLEFSLKPVTEKKSNASKWVPTRVHEILNERILDKASDVFDEKPDSNTVLIEPNGIISPFSLSMSVDQQINKIELDRFGKAAILEAKP